ncbi:MAG: rhodanese-like domain-containing protein [Deltaproteobacteria bacterium]
MRNIIFLIGFIFFTSYTATGQSINQSGIIKSVDAGQFNSLILSGKYLVLDIRTSKEFGEGHINSAINIDFYNKDFDQNVSIYKDRPLLIYSRSSAQSKQALTRLAELNFSEVIELENGLVAWKRAGYSLVK